MAMTITREVLEAYLACRYKGHLRLAGERGEQSDYGLLMGESRGRVRVAAAERLLARHEAGQALRDVTATLEVLQQGRPLLLDATVEGEGLSVHFDALQRKDGASRLGDFYYIPLLFHEGERPGREQRALLELLGLILAEVQGREPGWGVLIQGRGCQARRVKLGAGVRQARRALQEVRDMQRSGTPPRLTLNPHCQVCEFRQRCHAEATAKDDLSLLRAMGEKEIAKCGRRGIFTVTQLSCTFRPRRRDRRQKEKGQPHHHALQALAIRDKKIYVLGTPDLPACSTRIYLDLEGDPDRGFVYLLGLIVEVDGSEQRYSFWADTPADEPCLFRQFLEVVGRQEDFRLYAYGSYEAAFLRRMIKDSGEQKVGEKLLSRLVNVLAVVHSHAYFPTYSNGLKDIAGFLGFRWTKVDASGIQSLVWRRRWEDGQSAVLKDTLVTYNLEDCAALKEVTKFLSALCPVSHSEEGGKMAGNRTQEISRVEDIDPQAGRWDWARGHFAIPDFEFVNRRAYFDYQRDRVFIRTSQILQRSQLRERRRKGKKVLRPNKCVAMSSQECPFCGGTELVQSQDGRLARLAFDLRIRRGSMKRWVTRFTTTRHRCAACQKSFLPPDYLRLDEHGHALKSWAMYEHVAHRSPLASVAETLQECFGLPVSASDVYAFKALLARSYEETYKRLLEKIVGGFLLHVDETEVKLKGTAKGYVWVFTTLEDVVFMYRPSREGDFLRDLLKDFRGVLVSDFYTAYDSLKCEQQKCLLHLIRDVNQDIRGNPWDEELKGLASDLGRLLRTIVATIDRFGLKQRQLVKHGKDVEQFFRVIEGRAFRSEVADGYRDRLLKYRDKLFTFLHHDGVPWNNNPAEHAVKRFARYRDMADGRLTEGGLNEYLLLLSVCVTCKFKGVSFLKFLLSRQQDVDEFFRTRGRASPPPPFELRPAGVLSTKRQRGSWQKQARQMEARPLSESQRRAIFLALVAAQDRSMTVAQSRKAVAQHFELSELRVQEIEREGLNAAWPPLV